MGTATMAQNGTQRQSMSSIRSPMTRGTVSEITRNGTSNNTSAIAAAKNPNKEFPALAVTPKTAKSAAAFAAKRPELDAQIKSLLVLAPAKFTEWLIQQGLVLSEQHEVVGGKKKTKLKLGMYSDSKKFPNSGGYVWINESNPSKFVSVYRGSLFEASSQTPTVVLKLLYHWSCQTTITNILQWVKVDNATVNQYWELFRSVCVASVQEELVNLGGKGKVAEIGVISLGTTSSDGKNREVRVEVLGVLDRASGTVRLRATEPIKGASQNDRFAKIFEPLPVWVDSSTRIITDLSIDKDRLSRLGYNNVAQCNPQAKNASQTNSQVMEYLKRIVPKMFQNNLSLLKTNVIQQFLDELTFRESFAHHPLLCFEGIVKRVSNQTTAAASKSTFVSHRLKTIAEKPFQDWRISATNPKPNATSQANKSVNSSQNVNRPQTKPQSPQARPTPAKQAATPARPNQSSHQRQTPQIARQTLQNQSKNVVPARSQSTKSNQSNASRATSQASSPQMKSQQGIKRAADAELSRPKTRDESLESSVTEGPSVQKQSNASNVTLYMECKDEPLSTAQRSMQQKQFKEFKEQMLRLGDIAKEQAKFNAIPLALTDDSAPLDKPTNTNTNLSPSKESSFDKSRSASEESEVDKKDTSTLSDHEMEMDLPLF